MTQSLFSTTTIARDRDVLTCPHCRGDYLHHGQVTVYDRAEDAPRVTKIEVRDQSALISKVENSQSGNPSYRRDGLTIQFYCEHCDATSKLTIMQHKGQSFVGWRGNGHADQRA